MIESRTGAAETGIFDEDDSDLADHQEFDRALAAGTELLQAGNPAEARIALEKSLRYKPRNQRARNLLGLSLFKLGELERAEQIYRSLIEDHPADPTLRVNLGLVFLKSNSSADAVRCFETALDLQPEHQKAQNYLGLALAQKGELARAREFFRKSGNLAMAERMTQGLQSSPIRAVAQEAEAALNAARPFSAAVETKTAEPEGTAQGKTFAPVSAEAPKEGPKKGSTLEMARPAGLQQPEVAPAPQLTPALGTRWVATQPASGATAPLQVLTDAGSADTLVTTHFEPQVSLPPPPAPAAAAAAAPASPKPPEATASAASPSPRPSALSAYTLSTRLAIPTDEVGFAIGAAEVLIQVRREMLTRLDGLVASWGSVTLKPELKRFRGKATDKPFGDGARRMLRATGEGRFVIAREGRHFTALELGDEPAYFREEILYAFEESILFENGRVPSKTGADLHLVHLRGTGRLLLVTVGMPRSVEVQRGEALRIPMDQLIGWHGPLIQPRLVPIVEDAPELGVALELAGEGRALIDVPAGR